MKANDSTGSITIPYNTHATLSWTSTNARSTNPCRATGGWSGISAPDWNLEKTANGSESTGNLTSSKTYWIQCYNDAGVATLSSPVTVNVGSTQPQSGTPTVDLKVSPGAGAVPSDGPITIPYNTSATISWTYTNKTTSDAKPCWLWHEASNGLGGERRATGSESTGKLTASRTFNLRCGHEELTPSDSVTVNVADSITPMAGNQKPIAYANWSINGVNQGSKLFVKKGVPVNGLSLTGNSSSDPDGWTTVGKGVSQGGKCELNADMELGDTPSFERAIQDPAHSGACGAYFGSRTFNNAPGEYMIRIMRITDAGGLKSNDALVWVNVAAP